MIKEYDRCELCNEPMPDEHQIAEFAVKAGTATAHKQCLYQLMIGAWDELAHRRKRGIAHDAPYTSANIASPMVRKALRLDMSPEDRLEADYMEHGAPDALADLFTNDEDGFTQLVQAVQDRSIRKHL